MQDETLNVARTGLSAWNPRRLVRGAAAVLGGALLLAASAKLQVPFYPVPMTMQTLVVLVMGALLGARLASATVALYLVEGLVGLPVFAGAVAGPTYVVGPTGGYLIGFLVVAACLGGLADRGLLRSWLTLTLAMIVGHVAIFACGFGWLVVGLGVAKAWTVGVAPFYVATALKTALAIVLARTLPRFSL